MQGKKLKRFAELNTFSNVFQFPQDFKQTWDETFPSSQPVILELACGKGDYTIGLARNAPDKAFIGIDIKGNRMYIGARQALQESLTQVRFLRIRIEQLCDYIPPQRVDEIWITFPDPFLRESKAKNRLTHPKFLRLYQQVLRPGGLIHLKTDSQPLFEFTKEMVATYQCPVVDLQENIYIAGTPDFPLNIQTFYEKMHLADQRQIRYICFRLPETAIIPPPKKNTHVVDQDA